MGCEVGLDEIVNQEKVCYVGKKRKLLVRIKKKAVKRERVLIV